MALVNFGGGAFDDDDEAFWRRQSAPLAQPTDPWATWSQPSTQPTTQQQPSTPFDEWQTQRSRQPPTTTAPAPPPSTPPSSRPTPGPPRGRYDDRFPTTPPPSTTPPGGAVPRDPSSPTTPPTTPPKPPPHWDEQWFRANIGTPNTLQELIDMRAGILAHGGQLNKNQSGQWNGKITTPDGRIVDVMRAAGLGGTGFQWLEGDGNGGSDDGSGGVGYDNSASTTLFLNEVLSRLEQLRQPINDPYRELYEKYALQRIEGLGGDPYTAGEDAALRARYMNPLTQARDAAQLQAKERIGARGMMASSGLLEDSLGEIDQGYEQAVGQASNDLAVQAINERQNRQNQQLAILTDLLGEGRNVRSEDNARAVELLQTAGLFPEMDERRLQLLLQASGEGGGGMNSLMSTLMQLGQLGLTQQQLGQQNRQNSSYAWGQMIPFLLQALGLGGR